MECGQCFLSRPFAVLTVDQFAGHGGGPLERQKQDSHVQTNDRPGTFKCTRSRCKTCPFIHNAEKMSGPKRSIKITNHFTCTSANVLYCITCTYCKKLYISETGRRLSDQFLEHHEIW